MSQPSEVIFTKKRGKVIVSGPGDATKALVCTLSHMTAQLTQPLISKLHMYICTWPGNRRLKAMRLAATLGWQGEGCSLFTM